MRFTTSDHRERVLFAAIRNANANDRANANEMLNELEQQLALEQKRVRFLAAWGRWLVVDDAGNHWMERHDGPHDWKSAEFKTINEAIDAGMEYANWDDIERTIATLRAEGAVA